MSTQSANKPSSIVEAFDSESSASKTIQEKWGGVIYQNSGFVAVPMALLRAQARFGLSPTDMIVLINLLIHWWEPDSPVFTRSATIAKRMGASTRTVQRSLNKMIAKGIIAYGSRYEDRRTLDFEPLVKYLSNPGSFGATEHFTDPFFGA